MNIIIWVGLSLIILSGTLEYLADKRNDSYGCFTIILITLGVILVVFNQMFYEVVILGIR